MPADYTFCFLAGSRCNHLPFPNHHHTGIVRSGYSVCGQYTSDPGKCKQNPFPCSFNSSFRNQDKHGCSIRLQRPSNPVDLHLSGRLIPSHTQLKSHSFPSACRHFRDYRMGKTMQKVHPPDREKAVEINRSHVGAEMSHAASILCFRKSARDKLLFPRAFLSSRHSPR